MTTKVNSRGRCARTGLFIALWSVALLSQVAPFAEPQPIHPARVADAILFAEKYAPVLAERPLLIEGTVEMRQPIAASKIIFAPGSRLVVSLGESSSSPDIFLLAKKIQVNPGEPALLTWKRSQARELMPTSHTNAAPGAPGASEGGNGGTGAPGAQGIDGYPGLDAPSLVMFVGEIVGGTLYIDLRGQDGGPGGQGQTGGVGGIGGPGRSAVSSIFDCRAAGGTGGKGGDGGRGGKGGAGGRGGVGGSLVLIGEEGSVERSQRLLKPQLAGGGGGLPGAPGRGGQAGPGGYPGQVSGFCGGGSPGLSGTAGTEGEIGETVQQGEAGTFLVTSLVSRQINRIFRDN